MSFTHLQVKSGFSIMHSAMTIPKLVDKAKQLNFNALAITDEHVLYGVMPFYKACIANDIKPVIGMTVHINTQDQVTDTCILLAKTNHGYQQLSRMSTFLQTTQKSGLEKSELKEYCSELICILPFLHSRLNYMIGAASEAHMMDYLQDWQTLFAPGDFYIGVEDYGNEQERRSRQPLKMLLQKNKIPAAAINDVCYLEAQDDMAYDCLQAIRKGVQWDPEFADPVKKRHHLRSEGEMSAVFTDWPEAIRETEAIAKKCQVHFSFDKRMLPSYPLPDNQDAETFLRQLCQKNLKKKYPDADEKIRARLDYELDIITSMQFSDYFLIVWDFIKYAKDNHIMVGPGRGSSAGSLVAYVLGITEVDPMKHALLFERFLNPERVTMPDIDVDFSDRRRDEVIDYVKNKYGKEHVAQIVTFGTFASRSIIRELIKTLAIDQQDSQFILKQMPQQTSKTLQEIVQGIPALKEYISQSKKLRQLFSLAIRLEGLPRHISTHAAGVVISEQPLMEHVPLTASGGDMYLTQFTMTDLESLGLLKIDFLGLRNLTLIESILRSASQSTGQSITLQHVKDDDEKTFRMLKTGRTNGIFQLESEGMKRVLTQLKPSSFNDIVAVNALYRPGPMENIPVYIARKHGKQKITYPHPDLEPILKSTYGVLIYQEQIMQIAHQIAGFSLGEADILRRAVSKKKKEVMQQQKSLFIQGCVKNGYSQSIAEELFAWIVKFSNYGFPKGHAVAYSKIAYQLAYLKSHFTVYFYAELLSSTANQPDKLNLYLKEMKEFGIQLLPPDINASFGRFTVENGHIRIGLFGIKGISNKTVQEIMKARGKKRFKSLFDFYLRVSDKTVSRAAMETLILAGAFDDLHANRASLLASIDKAMEQGELFKEFADQADLFAEQFPSEESYVQMEDFSLLKKLADEKELLGMYISSHPLKSHRNRLNRQGYIPLGNADQFVGQKNLKAVAIVRQIKKIRTKRGESMAFLLLADETAELDAVIFPDLYREHGNWLKEESAVKIAGKLERRKKLQWVIFDIEPFQLEEINPSEGASISIRVIDHSGRETMQFLKKMLQRYPGQTPVMLVHDQQTYQVKNCLLQPDANCINELHAFFGPHHVKVVYSE